MMSRWSLCLREDALCGRLNGDGHLRRCCCRLERWWTGERDRQSFRLDRRWYWSGHHWSWRCYMDTRIRSYWTMMSQDSSSALSKSPSSLQVMIPSSATAWCPLTTSTMRSKVGWPTRCSFVINKTYSKPPRHTNCGASEKCYSYANQFESTW